MLFISFEVYTLVFFVTLLLSVRRNRCVIMDSSSSNDGDQINQISSGNLTPRKILKFCLDSSEAEDNISKEICQLMLYLQTLAM